MSLLNSITLIGYYMILADVIVKHFKRKDLSKKIYIRGLLFAFMQIIIGYLSNHNMSVSFITYFYIFVFIHLMIKTNIKHNILLTVIYLTINQLITTLIIMCQSMILHELMIIHEIIIALIIVIVIYWFYKSNIVDIFMLSQLTELFYPFLIIHFILDSTCLFFIYAESNHYIYISYVYIYLALIIVYIFMLYSATLKTKVKYFAYEKQLYENEIFFLEDVISINTSYQNDLHDMHSLLLKYQDEHLDIKEYICTKKPLMRIITSDRNFNIVLNSLINMNSFDQIEVDAIIVDEILINRIDLLILFYDLFSSMNNQGTIHITSHNHLLISFDKSIDIHINAENIINKYHGVIEKEQHKIILFYKKISDD